MPLIGKRTVSRRRRRGLAPAVHFEDLTATGTGPDPRCGSGPAGQGSWSVFGRVDGEHLEAVGIRFADGVVDTTKVDADVLGVVPGVVAVGAVDLVAAGEGEGDAEPLFVGLEVELVKELVEAVAADHFVLVLLDGVGAH